MKNTYNENTNDSVFNDYEESIIFDEDDPDFKKNDDLKYCYQNVYQCSKNGKSTSIKLSLIIMPFTRILRCHAQKDTGD